MQGADLFKFHASILFCVLAAGPVYGQMVKGDDQLPKTPESKRYHPMTLKERERWLLHSTIGAESLTAGVISSGIGTAFDRPKEYGPHFEGFAERYGMRLTGVATSNTMEAGLGLAFGEDPHYFRVGPKGPFKERLKSIVHETFYARERDGGYSLAYARLVAVPASNFLSNTWRADSEANVHDALIRTALGFAGHMTRNAWEEFKPRREDQALK